jgi:hypothetical protein
MKQSVRVIGGILLAVAVCSPAWAKKGGGGGGGGGGSQAGGLPALAARVKADEVLIAALQSAVNTLQGEVTAVSTLQSDVTDLQGQNNWAVVNEVAGVATLVRSSSVPGPVTATETGVGLAVVDFGKDVSGCDYEATIGGVGTTAPTQGQISVFSDASSVNAVDVQTFDTTGLTPTDSPFHLAVICP